MLAFWIFSTKNGHCVGRTNELGSMKNCLNKLAAAKGRYIAFDGHFPFTLPWKQQNTVLQPFKLGIHFTFIITADGSRHTWHYKVFVTLNTICLAQLCNKQLSTHCNHDAMIIIEDIGAI